MDYDTAIETVLLIKSFIVYDKIFLRLNCRKVSIDSESRCLFGSHFLRLCTKILAKHNCFVHEFFWLQLFAMD